MATRDVDTRALEREISKLERELARVQKSDEEVSQNLNLVKVDGMVGSPSPRGGRQRPRTLTHSRRCSALLASR